jgi:hypothetical protein
LWCRCWWWMKKKDGEENALFSPKLCCTRGGWISFPKIRFQTSLCPGRTIKLVNRVKIVESECVSFDLYIVDQKVNLMPSWQCVTTSRLPVFTTCTACVLSCVPSLPSLTLSSHSRTRLFGVSQSGITFTLSPFVLLETTVSIRLSPVLYWQYMCALCLSYLVSR